MSGAHGPHWYLDPKHFISSDQRDKLNNDSPFKYDLLRLFQKFPEVSFNQLGFTSNWKAEKIWALHDHL